MVKNKNKKPHARINFEKKKDNKLRFFLSRLIDVLSHAKVFKILRAIVEKNSN